MLPVVWGVASCNKICTSVMRPTVLIHVERYLDGCRQSPVASRHRHQSARTSFNLAGFSLVVVNIPKRNVILGAILQNPQTTHSIQIEEISKRQRWHFIVLPRHSDYLGRGVYRRTKGSFEGNSNASWPCPRPPPRTTSPSAPQHLQNPWVCIVYWVLENESYWPNSAS